MDGVAGGFDSLRIFGNTISGTDGKGLQFFGHITGADIHDNILTGLYQGVKGFTYESTFYPEGNTIYHNQITGASNLLVDWEGTGTFNVEENWWGSSTGPEAGKMSINVDYAPWCTDAACTNLASLPVYNVTQNLYYATIQAAIDAATAGDTVNVAAGTYAETITITKALTLNGVQAGTDARTRSGAEFVISSSDANGSVQVAATGTVTIDGFTISGSPVKAIHVTDVTTSVVVRNNIIEAASVDAINLFNAQSALVDQNWIKGAATSGITAGNDNGTPSELDGTITSATITNNKIENSQYGITGYQSGSTISGNEVIGSGSLALGAGIGGQFHDTSITANTVHGYSAGAGIAFNNDFSNRADSSEVTVSSNEVYDNAYGIYINQPLDGNNIVVSDKNKILTNGVYELVLDATRTTGGPLDATENWWGSSTGPEAGKISGNVDYAPWCTDAACTQLSSTAVSQWASGATASSEYYLYELGSSPSHRRTEHEFVWRPADGLVTRDFRVGS